MAIISNINGKLTVSDQGQVSFNRIGTSTTTGYTFPALDGTANQILKTNSNGVLTFVDDENDDTLYALAGAASGTNYNLVLSADGSAQNTMVFKPGTNVTFTKAANSLTINSSDQYEGTVKSVGYTHQGNAFTVGGQPITSTGIIAVTMAGTSSQYIDGAGNLTNISTLPDSVNDIAVTVASYGGGNRYFLDGERQIPAILKPGFTYRFDQSSSANVGNSGHPLRFSTNDNNSPAAPYTTGVTAVGTPGSAGAYTQIITSQATPYLYYYCNVHSGMGGPVPRQVNQISTGQGITAVPIDGNVQISNALATTVNNGGIRIGYSSIGSTDYPVLLSSNKAYVNISGSSNLSRWTASGTNIYNNNSGNVGIGDTTPSFPLVISKSSSSTGNGSDVSMRLGLNNPDQTNNNYALITFGDGTTQPGSGFFGMQFTDHTNNYGDLCFGTRGASGYGEKMRITSGGNVGIGTTNPTLSKLVISGGVTGSLGGGDAGITMINKFDNPDNSWSILPVISGVSNTGFCIRDNTDSVDRLVITGTGEIGMGTNSPAKKLEILSTASNHLRLAFNETAFWDMFLNSADGSLRILKDNGKLFTFTQSGNLGIGTSSPVGKLTVSASEGGKGIETQVTTGSGLQYIIAYNRTVGATGYLDMALAGNTFQVQTGASAVQRMFIASSGQILFNRTGQPPITNSLYGNIVLQTNAVTNFQRIRFDVGTTAYWGLTKLNTGNFAITGGSTWNDHAFELQYATGNVQVNETIGQRRFNVYDASDTWIRLYCGSSADWIFGANGSDHTFKWYNQSSNGGAGYKMAIATSGTLTVSADVIAFGSPSDIRLKENIKPIESALDKVSKLQGVTFDWKESDSILDIKEDIGFIAQDVQKVIPELVRENEDGMLSMRHQGIAPILLEAIKELKQEIEELKKCNCDCKK